MDIFLRLLASHWRWLVPSMVALAALVMWKIADGEADKNAAQRDYYKGELQRVIEDGQKRQDRADKAVRSGKAVIDRADGKAKVIETQPLKGDCSTPSEVMEADL